MNWHPRAEKPPQPGRYAVWFPARASFRDNWWNGKVWADDFVDDWTHWAEVEGAVGGTVKDARRQFATLLGANLETKRGEQTIRRIKA